MKLLNNKILYIVAILVFFAPQLASSKDEKNYSFSFGPSVHSFDYKELDLDLLDPPLKSTEKGTIYGAKVTFNFRNPKNYLFEEFSLFAAKSDTDYDGTNNDGTARLDITHNRFLNLDWQIGFLLGSKYISFTPFTGLGYFYWQRDLGFDEYYSWYYANIGARIDIQVTDIIKWAVSARYKKMFAAKIRIELSDLDPLFNDSTSNLGNKGGFRVESPLTILTPYMFSLTLTPWYEYYEIGQGDNFDIYYNGSFWGTGYEPASETETYGMEIMLTHEF